MSNTPTLSDLFLALHDRLACELGITRRTVKHNATMGAVSEDQWIKMLYEHLPKRYKVNRAFVIDSNGTCSKQIDVVIHDRQYSPFVLNYGGALYVPAESVYAVFDAKQCITADEVRDTAEKIASVRALHRTSVDIPTADSVLRAKKPHYILGGLLAVNCDWSMPFGTSFASAISAAAGSGQIDIGCAAEHGFFNVTYSESGAPVIDAQLTSAGLALFLLRLIDRLRSIATVPAIDILAYASNGIVSTPAASSELSPASPIVSRPA